MGHNADRLKLGQRFGATVEALAEPTIVSGILRRRKAECPLFCVRVDFWLCWPAAASPAAA